MVIFVYGTRPEAIKLGPILHELRTLSVVTHILCTGQHTDLLAGTPAESDLAGAESLGLASADSIPRFLTKATAVLRQRLRELHPKLVVVQGDTMSVCAAAQAAHQENIPLAHVEAGVRSHTTEEPWPEEEFRIHIDALATYHLAATRQAADNLASEGISGAVVTGNSVVSALARYSTARPAPETGALLLITLHRRELRLSPAVYAVIDTLFAEARARPDVSFFWPIHPAMRPLLGNREPPTNFVIANPVPYAKAVEGLACCRGVLTDSGGLVEEAATLGVPCAILRNVNDRPEAVAAGVARMHFPTAQGVKNAVWMLVNCELPRRPTDAFGTPEAASTIAAALAATLAPLKVIA